MKTLALTFLRKTLGVPILWLGLGVVAICASFGLSYLRAQIEADYALTMRLGPPEAMAIAEAEAGRLGEGHVTARFHPEQAVTVRMGPPGARSDWLAVPLFSAGAAARPPPECPARKARAWRPHARPSRRSRPFLPQRPGPETLLAGDARVFEGAAQRPAHPLEAFALDTAAALAEAGIALPADFVAIRPWTQGRAAALAPPPEGALSRYLLWTGILSVLGSLALSLRASEEGDRYLTITAVRTRAQSP